MNAIELRMPTRRPAWREDGLMRSLGAPFALPQPPQSLPEPHWVDKQAEHEADAGFPPDWARRLEVSYSS